MNVYATGNRCSKSTLIENKHNRFEWTRLKVTESVSLASFQRFEFAHIYSSGHAANASQCWSSPGWPTNFDNVSDDPRLVAVLGELWYRSQTAGAIAS